MRKLVAFFLIVIFISACSGKNKIPKDILPKQKMEDVLWDIVKAGEFLEVYLLPKDTNAVKSPKIQEWYDHVFQLHKVTREQFIKSYDWYQQHPSVMKEVLDSLSAKPAPQFKPPGQQTIDSTAYRDSLKRLDDSLRKKPPILPGQRKPDFMDSLRKARGNRPLPV